MAVDVAARGPLLLCAVGWRVLGAVAAGWVWGRATGARFPESDHRFWHLKPACRGRRGAGQGFRCRSVRLPAVQNTRGRDQWPARWVFWLLWDRSVRPRLRFSDWGPRPRGCTEALRLFVVEGSRRAGLPLRRQLCTRLRVVAAPYRSVGLVKTLVMRLCVAPTVGEPLCGLEPSLVREP